MCAQFHDYIILRGNPEPYVLRLALARSALRMAVHRCGPVVCVVGAGGLKSAPNVMIAKELRQLLTIGVLVRRARH